MNPPDEPTPNETHEVCQALPHQQKIHEITVHYTVYPPPRGGIQTGQNDTDEREGVFTTGPTARLPGCTGLNKCIGPRQSLALWPLNWPA